MSLAHASLAPDRAGRDARPLARAITGALFLAVVFLLFAVSSGVLWNLGVNYNGVTGAIASKIHPATYLACVIIGFLIVARRNPASFFVSIVTRHPGTLAFLLAILIGIHVAAAAYHHFVQKDDVARRMLPFMTPTGGDRP